MSFSSMSDDELFRAAQRGDTGTVYRLVQQLLQEGAPPVVFRLALNVAIWNDHGEIVREIVRRVGRRLVHEWDTWERYLLLSARRDSAAAARALMQSASQYGGLVRSGTSVYKSALKDAAANNSATMMALLIPRVSICEREALFIMCAAEGNLRAVKVLSRGNVNLNSRDWWAKWTALHHAATKGHARVVAQLLWCKADPRVQTGGCNTALELATLKGHVAAASVLRRFAAKENEETTA